MKAYDLLFSGILRHLDTELAHTLGAVVVRSAGRLRPGVRADPILRTRALGRDFPTPFGVAAGFDKNAHMLLGLGALGFGHVEVGTVTPKAQPGNPKPRLARLVDDRALINRMGFNNDGAAAVAERLREARSNPKRPVIGVNIGKNKVTELEHAADDYRSAAAQLAPYADYLAVNVSSPNTPGLRGLQDETQLEPILTGVLAASGSIPVLVKIAPDLDDEQIRGIGQLVTDLGLAGVIATNTTISREGLRTDAAAVAAAGDGGLSGPILAERSLAVLRILRDALPEDATIVSVGGVVSAADVLERLDAGASLVQGYTSFVYEGPGWARQINRDLAALLRARR